MATVVYDHQFDYSHDQLGRRYPVLVCRLLNPATAEAIELEGYLDSGAERSMFSGPLALVIGLDLFTGRELRYQPAVGPPFSAWLHRVHIEHEQLGTSDLEVGFTPNEIRRNILGRDFFDGAQIGFREHQLTFYVTAQP